MVKNTLKESQWDLFFLKRKIYIIKTRKIETERLQQQGPRPDTKNHYGLTKK